MSNAREGAPLPALLAVPGGRGGAAAGDDARRDQARLRDLVRDHLDRVARIVRHLGAPRAEAEDLVQQAFSVTAARLPDITPGKERAFLVETAVRLAANARRASARGRETASGDLPDVEDHRPSPEELSDRRRALAVMDRVLDDMDSDLREVFVLYEVEEMTMAEIASVLALPAGTVASRLRRGRAAFLARLRRLGLGAAAPEGGRP